jgi:hypothetical protein
MSLCEAIPKKSLRTLHNHRIDVKISTQFLENLMTHSQHSNQSLTDAEWQELVALKDAINQNPASVHPEKMELFTQLLVRSWEAKCDPPNTSKWRTGHPLDE